MQNSSKDMTLMMIYPKMIYAKILILETQYKIKPKHSIRSEIQHLSTKQHEGNWVMALLEYTISPNYFLLFKTSITTEMKHQN